MYVKEVLVQNKAGLHARPATFFIQKANEYKSTIWVEKEDICTCLSRSRHTSCKCKKSSRCVVPRNYRRHYY